jgi:hypothetical protein
MQNWHKTLSKKQTISKRIGAWLKWWITCLALTIPWVHFPAPQRKKEKKRKTQKDEEEEEEKGERVI